MSRILDNLFLGDMNDAHSREFLIENGITHVINCAREIPDMHSDIVTHLRLDADDSFQQNMHQHFIKAIDFIDNASGRVLVHCFAGVSRSATIVIAYLMNLNRTFDHMRCYNFVQARRPMIAPNLAFMGQLLKFRDDLNNTLID